jgi:hypothetical protein
LSELDPELAEALELVVAHTRHEPFRQLVRKSEFFRNDVLRRAAALRGAPPPPERPPTAVGAKPAANYERWTRAWLARINTCLYRQCPRGCQSSRCHARRDKFDRLLSVSLADCRDCLRGAAWPEKPEVKV